ncbi:MAG: hypothetical protein U5K37_10350 [Natrialbaceae archaeon]|nr:hypothetical protein [Natrialbaceae archaeon]
MSIQTPSTHADTPIDSTTSDATAEISALAPKTFSSARTDRLENLVDRFNAAFAESGTETAS